MANNPGEVPNQDFLEHLLELQRYAASSPLANPNLAISNMNMTGPAGGCPMMLQLSSNGGNHIAGGVFQAPEFPLGLSLEHGRSGFLKNDEACSSIDTGAAPPRNVFHGQPMANSFPAAPNQSTVRPRVRARRGQATDPHSIAERLRRERIAERIRALQELVPSVNKIDKAAMLDEVVDYVKFLRLQVKVLSMSRLGAAGAVVPLVTDMPTASVEEEGVEGGKGQPVWEKWSNDGTECQVAKLMEENVGSAMQFLQSKALCIMPISLASAIYHTQPPDGASLIEPESNPPS